MTHERVRYVLERRFPLETEDGRLQLDLLEETLEIDDDAVYGTMRYVLWEIEGGRRSIRDIKEQSGIYLGDREHVLEVARYDAFVKAIERALEACDDPDVPRAFVCAAQLHDPDRTEPSEFRHDADSETLTPIASSGDEDIVPLRNHASGVTELAVRADGRMVVSSDGHTLVGWRCDRARPLWQHDVSVTGSIDISPTGDRLLVGEGEPTRPVLRSMEDGTIEARAELEAQYSNFSASSSHHVCVVQEGQDVQSQWTIYEGWPPEHAAGPVTSLRLKTHDICMNREATFALFYGHGSAACCDLESMERTWEETFRIPDLEAMDDSRPERFEIPETFDELQMNASIRTSRVAINTAFGWSLFDLETGDRVTDGSLSFEVGRAIALAPDGVHLALPSDSEGASGEAISVVRLRFEPRRYVDRERVCRLEDQSNSTATSMTFSDDGSVLAVGRADGSVAAFEIGL